MSRRQRTSHASRRSPRHHAVSGRWTALSLRQEPMGDAPAVYVPTMSPRGLIPWAAVDEAPGTSILVKLPSLSSRNP